MISEFQIRVLPRIAANDEEIKKYIAEIRAVILCIVIGSIPLFITLV